jgi:hypothetical protein
LLKTNQLTENFADVKLRSEMELPMSLESIRGQAVEEGIELDDGTWRVWHLDEPNPILRTTRKFSDMTAATHFAGDTKNGRRMAVTGPRKYVEFLDGNPLPAKPPRQ